MNVAALVTTGALATLLSCSPGKVSAEWLDCDSLDHARSAESSEATPINIENATSYSLDLYWINFDGEAVYYNTVHPGETLSQDTYFDHLWFVSYQKGFCRNAMSVDYGYEYFRLYE
jgi:hypothetical protein